MFVDSARIRVKAGNGGAGCVSFRREKYVPRGGPDGGDGGKGGDVIIIAKEAAKTLYDCQERHYWNAPRGAHGSGKNRRGKSGEDLVIPVPAGTVVRDVDAGEELADLTRHEQRVVVAKGGKGGRGNTAFKSSTNKAPRTAEPGERGESRHLLLTLKVLADIALIGLPNAGKSSLISSISAAHPKIADYSFTTKEPHLGVVCPDGTFSFTVADIPGLVEGAHSGRGLGIRFLQHTQRAELLVLVVDASKDAAVPPLEACRVVETELAYFDPSLPKRIAFLAANKIDLVCSPSSLEEVRGFCRERRIELFELSALTGEGIQTFLSALASRMTIKEAVVSG